MRFTLSNRQEKALHLNGQPLQLCLPIPESDHSTSDPTLLARASISAEGVRVENASWIAITVRIWLGPRQAPDSLGNAFGEIEAEDSAPPVPGQVRTTVVVLACMVYSMAKTPKRDPAPLSWPGDCIPDGESKPFLKTARQRADTPVKGRTMEACEFVDRLKDEKRMVRVAAYTPDGRCIGRAQALVIDEKNRMAILVEDCANPIETNAPRGAIVHYSNHPEQEEPRIIGTPAFLREFQVRHGDEIKHFGRG